MLKIFNSIFFYFNIYHVIAVCPREETHNGLSVVWPETLAGNDIKSNPLCYHHEDVVKRNCVDTQWVPAATTLTSCEDEHHHDDPPKDYTTTCPPSFYEISRNIKEFCYQTSVFSSWDYPCLKSGGAAVITDFADNDVEELLMSLKVRNISRYFWLPGRRSKIFSPMTWYVSGPNWGRTVESNNMLKMSASILKNCLLLDIDSQMIIAETCSAEYPSLCFYINSIYYPAKCPENYHSVRYMVDKGVCLGIEYSERNLSFDQFKNEKCKTPMGDADSGELIRYVFKKIAETNDLPDSKWCWFSKMNYFNHMYETNEPATIADNTTRPVYVSINNIGVLSIMNSSALLPCMACQTEVTYDTTEFMFEYNENDNVVYLTVYYPSGLWKYDVYDNGIQCFSDASGLVHVIDIKNLPNLTITHDDQNKETDDPEVEKATYKINLVTNSPAQYWCEGHSKNFSLISTDKIVVNPKYGEVHVFALVIEFYITSDDIQNELKAIISTLTNNIEHIFKASRVLIMEILNYTQNCLMILLHLHIPVEKYFKPDDTNLLNLYTLLKSIAETELENYNYTFINLTSSMYCLPTFSKDNLLKLDWETTPIGQITAPKQFCLQDNGLPVKRFCGGSYLFGGIWGNVEGACHTNYAPSSATTFLYKFVKGLVPKNYTSNFLTYGLGFVLKDLNIIIPADIYYLAMSLQHALRITRENETFIDIGNIENIAWAMNRIMILNNNYLHLAQTLNSTNIILDTVTNIIEEITQKGGHRRRNAFSKYYHFAVQPQFIIQVTYPIINNISGIAVIKKSASNYFTDVEIKPLYINTSISDILSIDNLEIAAWLSNAAIRSLIKNTNESKIEKNNDNDLHVIINVFHNNAMFQELNPNHFIVNSRIIGLAVPGYISNLKHPITLIYKDLHYINHSKHCGYWEFHADSNTDIPGHWSNRGCYFKYTKNNLTICECYHLTHFGQLLTLRKSSQDTGLNNNLEQHTKNLNIISLVGSFLSLLGIVVIYITATLFTKWRQKAGTKVLLNLSGAIALPLIFMVIFNLGNSMFKERNEDEDYSDNIRIVCITLGALLHYSVLASFMWMLITAILQFIRYVRVLGVHRPSRFIMKFTLIGWGVPSVPVIIILVIDKDNYMPESFLGNICYPTGIYLIIGVVVPICLILFINVTLYIFVLCAISRGPDGKIRSVDMDLIGAQFRLSIFLFFLLGLTWIFGLFSFSYNAIWSYLFCLTSTLQGFVLFVYFIICDPETRNLWISLMTRSRSNSKPRESITSISSG